MCAILQLVSVPLNPTVLQLFIRRMPKMCAILQLVSAPLNPTVLQLFIRRMPKMCAILQLVSAPLNPTILQKTVIGGIGKLLTERHAIEKGKNRKIWLSILSNIRYLGQQALLLRGEDWNIGTKSEENSNFHQLLKL